MQWWAMLMTVVNIILIYVVYLYLDNLKTCDCVNQSITAKLKDTQYTILQLTVIGSLLAIINTVFGMTSSKNKTVKMGIIASYIVLYIASVVIDVKFIYNTYNFHKTLQSPCECANKWQKYVIYIDAILYTITISMTVFTIILLGKMIGFSNLKSLAMKEYDKK